MKDVLVHLDNQAEERARAEKALDDNARLRAINEALVGALAKIAAWNDCNRFHCEENTRVARAALLKARGQK